MRETIVSFLRQRDRIEIVDIVADGGQAVRRALAVAPDLVLMDVQLPGIGGLEATRRIKAHQGLVKIIIMTLDDSPGCRAAAQAAGADAFLAKNGDLPAQLPAAIQALFPEVTI
jgi:CheY-like chemotaxis protein